MCAEKKPKLKKNIFIVPNAKFFQSNCAQIMPNNESESNKLVNNLGTR